MLRRADWITLLTTEFDSIGHHVKNDKRGACEHKAATALPNSTAATISTLACLLLSSI